MTLSKGQVFGVVVMILVGVGGLGWCILQAPAEALKVVGLTGGVLAAFFILVWLMIVARRRPRGSGLSELPWRLVRGVDDVFRLLGAASGVVVGEAAPPSPAAARNAKARRKAKRRP